MILRVLSDSARVSSNTAASRVLIIRIGANFLTADIGVLIFHHEQLFDPGIA
jgi:hypothetical protein